MKVAGDLEADGLLFTATKVWCAVFIDIDTEDMYYWINPCTGLASTCLPPKGGRVTKKVPDLTKFLDSTNEVIIHNAYGYDIPVLEKTMGYIYTGAVTDTMILSYLLDADRPRPEGLPKKKGPHGLDAWGIRVGVGKPKHEEWDRFSYDMLIRCKDDAIITHKTYVKLQEEMK